jgi:predicted N-acetyltransferase YhbS
VIVRLEEPADRPASLEVEREAFGSSTEAAIVEAIRDEPGSFALSPRRMARSSVTCS